MPENLGSYPPTNPPTHHHHQPEKGKRKKNQPREQTGLLQVA
jgi:hypothetical protein